MLERDRIAIARDQQDRQKDLCQEAKVQFRFGRRREPQMCEYFIDRLRPWVLSLDSAVASRRNAGERKQ
jgi:hypothetical protein